ncbi:O-antigen ligase family protein [Methylobacterium sp. JK268]
MTQAVTALPGDRTLSLSEKAFRATLFCVTVLLYWINLEPFTDLSRASYLDVKSQADQFWQLAILGLAACHLAFLIARHAARIRLILSPLTLVMFGWFAVTALASPEADLSLRRLVLNALVLIQAGSLLLLPWDQRSFARLLGACAGVMLLLCYGGVILVPNRAIHQATDVWEPDLAGGWRGSFAHKNEAGAGMAILCFIGLYVARTGSRAGGLAIAAAAFVFLLFTRSKSPLMLFPVSLIAARLLTAGIGRGWKLALAALMLVFTHLLTIGSVTLEPVHAFVHATMSDPTFTGRDQIWTFTIAHILQRPVLGWGFQAFWGTAGLVHSWSFTESWGARAAHAHNAVLNMAVLTGVVGLMLSMLWTFWQPLRCFLANAARTDSAAWANRSLDLMFIRIWCFVLLLTGYEAILFTGGKTVWFVMLTTVFGLRFSALAPAPTAART